jgi:nucleolar pre-ribosomal-associated protein 1
MIADSIMFDHDRYEWDLWMQCLPRTRSLAIKTSATLALERLHLLGFIDECIRRCMKTPYRYIEEAAAHAGERSNEANPAALPSPLLFAMFEQFQAKLAGHHIATDAAEVIIIYLRQVILSLTAKQLDTAYIQSLSHRLETCVIAAEIKRETPLSALKAQTNLLVAQVSSYESQQVTSTKSLEHKLVEGQSSMRHLTRSWLRSRCFYR